MKKDKKQTVCVKQGEFSPTKPPLQPNNWLQAAEDTRLRIKDYEAKIRRLRRAAKVFESYAEEGEPWPGQA
jgi:hypothetical protein